MGLTLHVRVARARRLMRSSPHVMKPAIVAALVLVMFIASVIEAALWAVTYIAVGAITGFEKALYFSTVTYTTLGYGDVTLEGQWRLLSAFEAANGIIMFGWTTALIVWAVQRVYSIPAAPELEPHDV
ncbi:MAG: two pore domain potassium channel family protein [Planctomycetes bacterium]|nr:two pore domain potassium channel family protein [Planctomycetota bacterium]